MAKAKEQLDLQEQLRSIDDGKQIMYDSAMLALQQRQIDSKPSTKSGKSFVDGYNCGIRDSVRILYKVRYSDDYDYDYDLDFGDKADPWSFLDKK